MKRIKKVITFLIIGVVLSSCDLLTNPEPQGAVNIQTLDEFKGYEVLLNGVYNGLQGWGGQVLYFDDSMTDFMEWVFSFTSYRQIAFQDMTPNNSTITGFWNQMYQSINAANIIIANINKVKDASPDEIDNVLGQAYFLRALMYYYLIKYYAKPWGAKTDNSQLGVPLKLEPVINSNDFKHIKRATVKDIYDQIIDDLKKADGLNIINKSSAKATNGAVTALQARIALIQERWDDAAKLAGSVISDYNYKLSSEVLDFFRSEFGSEAIFVIANTPSDSPGAGNTSISVLFSISGRPGARVGPAYKAALKKIVTDKQEAVLKSNNMIAVDTRITSLLTTVAEPPLTIDDYTHSAKYEDYLTNADNDPILRLSEMILTRAEALAELNGINKESLVLLNQIRTRAIKVKKQNGDPGNKSLIEYSVADFQTKKELINAIFIERSIELAFEGHRRTDLQRKELDVQGTPWNANKLVFPIPQSQIDVSDMQQNPGY